MNLEIILMGDIYFLIFFISYSQETNKKDQNPLETNKEILTIESIVPENVSNS